MSKKNKRKNNVRNNKNNNTQVSDDIIEESIIDDNKTDIESDIVLDDEDNGISEAAEDEMFKDGILKSGNKYIVIIGLFIGYLIISAALLISDHYREKEYATYNMASVANYPSQFLGREPEYKQYFYTPRRTNGLDVQFATYGIEPKKDLYLEVFDAETDEKLVECKIKHKKISDNQYTRSVFKDFVLEEGKHFYFDVYSKAKNPETVVYWLGSNDCVYADQLYYKGELIEDTAACFSLIYEYNGRGLISWIFVSVIFALLMNAVVVKLYGDEKIRYQVVAVLLQMSMIVVMLWLYANYIR